MCRHALSLMIPAANFLVFALPRTFAASCVQFPMRTYCYYGHVPVHTRTRTHRSLSVANVLRRIAHQRCFFLLGHCAVSGRPNAHVTNFR
jgi:hypothetical protein